jgi:hypothetical protein
MGYLRDYVDSGRDGNNAGVQVTESGGLKRSRGR